MRGVPEETHSDITKPLRADGARGDFQMDIGVQQEFQKVDEDVCE